jgi:hypothetical protein
MRHRALWIARIKTERMAALAMFLHANGLQAFPTRLRNMATSAQQYLNAGRRFNALIGKVLSMIEIETRLLLDSWRS